MTHDLRYQFHICSEHKRPVAAGTVVDLRIESDSPAIDHWTVDWTVEGPFSGMFRTFQTAGPALDWDTDGARAGSYTVRAHLTPPPDGGQVTGNGGPPAARATAMPSPAVSILGGLSAAAPAAQTMVTHATGTTPAELNYDAEPWKVLLTPAASANQDGIVPVSLQRTALIDTVDQALWVIIRDRTNAIQFRPYQTFIDSVMGGGNTRLGVDNLPFRGGDAYALLKYATDAFLMQEVGTLDPLRVLRDGGVGDGGALLNSEAALESLDEQLNDPTRAEALRAQEERRLGRPLKLDQLRRMRDSYYVALKETSPPSLVLPYLRIIRERLADIPLKSSAVVPAGAYGILPSHLTAPLAIELFWSYWLEEGMLAQTLNAILARFQNRRVLPDGRPDPLARFDVDPLRPLGNILWGWAEGETNRLTVRRRHLEYEHAYGLPLHGRALRGQPSPVDRRSKFLEALHNLLYLAHVYFKESDDTTIIADGFPVLNALRETHLLLAEGAHNQFGDLPATARSEMMVMQWMLARPELRDFLGGRTMVPYEETWMDRVDSMKQVQGWTDVSITHFRDMAVFGEQILLSVRYGNWSVENDPQAAANWARYWRAEIQRYVHAYRAATGVDLVEEVDNTPPALLLRRRMGHPSRIELAGGRRPALDGVRQPQITARREAQSMLGHASAERERG